MSDNLPERAAIVANKNLVQLTIEQMYRFATGYARADVIQGKSWNTVASPDDLFMRISAGQAIGLDPYTAVSEMYFVKGKLTMSTNLQLALAKASGKYDYRVEWGDSLQEIGITELPIGLSKAVAVSWPTPRWCRMTVYSMPDKEIIGESLFTLIDSWRAGLLEPSKNGEPSNHLKYPRNMLFNRAGSNAIAFYMPDATMIRAYDHGEVEGDVWGEQRGPSTVTAEVVPEPQPSSSAAAPAAEEEVIQDAEVFTEEADAAARAREEAEDAPPGRSPSASSAEPQAAPVQDSEPLTPAHDPVTGEMREGESSVEAMERMVREEFEASELAQQTGRVRPEDFDPATEPAPAPVAPPPTVATEGPTVETSEHVKTLELPRQKLLFALCRRANLTDARRYEITTEVCGQPHMDRVPDSAFQAMLDRLNAEVAMVEDPGPEEGS